jgi:hypothetical protein
MSDIVEKFDQVRELLMRRKTIHRSYAAVFGTSEGDVVLQHILSEGFVTKSTFVEGDPNQTMLNEGSRRLALSILKMARTNHKEVILQIERNLQDQGMQV